MPITKNLATNEREWRALLNSDDKNVVRNLKGWTKLLASKESPLIGVDKETVAKFTRTLKFKGGGFAHADFSMLVDTLPFSKFRRIWEHFGMSLDFFADHEGYSCVGRADCKKLHNHICMSGC